MKAAMKLGAALLISLVLLAGCAFVPPAPPIVDPVSGSESQTPEPVLPPTNSGASTSGYWSGYWTWDKGKRKWFWTWVWHSSSTGYSTS